MFYFAYSGSYEQKKHRYQNREWYKECWSRDTSCFVSVKLVSSLAFLVLELTAITVCVNFVAEWTN